MNIPVSSPEITDIDKKAVLECLDSDIISGISPYTKRFGTAFATWNGQGYGFPVNSGTSALHLALATLGVKRGDEVIMPSFTMISSANAATYLGAKPVFVDIEPDTWNMDTSKIKDVITPLTKAIMPVHIYGHPCEITDIMEVAWDHDLYVVEDAAEAHGATYKGKHVGGFGDIGCYSFYANKIITTGEGGMMTFNEEDLYERAAWLGAHAFGKKGVHYWHTDVGYGYRMTGMQAALGLSQLNRIDYYIQKRQMNAWYYMQLLADLRDEGLITFPVQRKHCTNVYWMFSILLTDEGLKKVKRDKLISLLAARGVETRTFFYPLHIQPPYKKRLRLPVTMDVHRRGINLPSGNTLSKQEIEYVCDAVKEILI